MARLNEPPAAPAAATAQPGAEGVDALKRRFIRQNRELAKNNSSQSLRIRSLELEVSRLLADNLDLRNQTLQLHNDLHVARSRAATAAIAKVKRDLRAKMAELNGLVDGIEEAPEASPLNREKRRPEGNWRERQPLTEIMRDSQMPTITEDKMYPRRTLGADEIQAIRLSGHSSNESPDLGPPPIAHFDYEDPVKQASPLSGKTSPQDHAAGEEDVLHSTFSVNLETRRKRKDGQTRLEIRRRSMLPQSPPKAEDDQTATVRAGAKRKLADREIEKPIKPPSRGDFSFSRKPTAGDIKVNAEKTTSDVKVNGEKATSEVIRARSEGRGQRSADNSTEPAKPSRRVLGDKNVNMSPRKVASTTGKSEKERPERPMTSKPATTKEDAATRRRRTSSIPLPSPPREIIKIADIAPLEPAASAVSLPNTPAECDLFLPTPSEPSADPDRRGDTPPPSDLSGLSTTTDGGPRPSRRARGAVNYAEPSLISKMRRPDKKMVDAISGLQDPRRAMNASTEKSASASQPLAIKREDGDENEDAWMQLPHTQQQQHNNNREPTSPLQGKSTGEATGSGSTDPAPAEEVAAAAGVSTTGLETYMASTKRSSSSSTISALMAGSRRRRESSQQQPLGTDMVESATKRMEDLDIYDFRDSSSPASSSSTTMSHRRHSSVPGKVVSAAARTGGLGGDDSGGGGLNTGVGMGRVSSRRRSMVL